MSSPRRRGKRLVSEKPGFGPLWAKSSFLMESSTVRLRASTQEGAAASPVQPPTTTQAVPAAGASPDMHAVFVRMDALSPSCEGQDASQLSGPPGKTGGQALQRQSC